MNAFRDRAALALALVSLGVSAFVLLKRSDSPSSPQASADAAAFAASRESIAEMRQSLVGLATELDDLKRAVGAAESDPAAANSQAPDEEGESSADGAPQFASIDQRLRNLEGSLNRLRSNYEGISIEGASAERAELFASAEGAIKADEYFEAGKFSIAAEGYLTYLRNNPDDPDARSVLQRARRAYQRAGYDDMAMWVQGEMMENFPENRAADLKDLAAMEKVAGNLDAAIEHVAESADLTTNTQERLWTRLYWAWYNQLRDGAPAGLDAYLEVQREINDAGFDDHKLNARAQEKIDELRKELAAGR